MREVADFVDVVLRFRIVAIEIEQSHSHLPLKRLVEVTELSCGSVHGLGHDTGSVSSGLDSP